MESEVSSFFFYFVDVAAFLFNATHTIETRTGGGAHTTCYANQKVSISNIPAALGM